MNKAFDKILERLEELQNYACFPAEWANEEQSKVHSYYANKLTEILKLTEQYSNGWIPCSERLPEDDSICMVTVEYPNNETVVDYGWFDRKSVCWFVGTQEFRTSNILAWQQLPEPYKQKGE